MVDAPTIRRRDIPSILVVGDARTARRVGNLIAPFPVLCAPDFEEASEAMRTSARYVVIVTWMCQRERPGDLRAIGVDTNAALVGLDELGHGARAGSVIEEAMRRVGVRRRSNEPGL
jgi:hypothetical protein